MRPARTVSEILGVFVEQSSLEEMNESLRHEAKRALVNMFGCALGAARSPPVESAVRVLEQLSCSPRASLIGRPERFDVLNTSFVNAVAANLFDFDDTHLSTVIHPTAPIAPAALALAEERDLPGAAVLHALILGIEVGCRLGKGVSPGHYARGWHITATCGVFGAAAASAKLLGLSASRTAHALGIAASQAAGIVENLSTGAKNVGVGNAARNGIFAALMADVGYEASATAIEGSLGWARAFGDDPDVEFMTGKLGDHWEMLSNTYKPYPAGIVFHAVIDACIGLRTEHNLDPDLIRSVDVSGDALLLARGDRPVNNERDARVSIHHSAAVALLRGTAGLCDYSTEATADPKVAAFRSLVHAKLDAELPKGAARVEIRLKDGRVLSTTVTKPKGSAEFPLSDRDIESKARALTRWGGTGVDVEGIIERIWNFDSQIGVRSLMEHARSSK